MTTLARAGNFFELNPVSGATGTVLEFQGGIVTAGQFGAWTPIGAVATATGYEVAWQIPGGNAYTIWNLDKNGNYVSSAVGSVSGQSFALEDFETNFDEDLNYDGRLSTALVTGVGAGSAVDLTAQTSATTINLGANAASASNLSSSILTLVGTPDVVTLGASADIVEYALSARSGIETLSNFIFGQDEINLDLGGAANGTLTMHDTSVLGESAVAIYNSADPLHGLVLLDPSGTFSAASLLGSHTTFVGGHALIN